LEMGSERSGPRDLQAHMTDMLPQVYLSRPGETAWSLSGQVTGRTDIPLTHRGERDAQELAKQLQGLSIVQVLTSPLQRARRTAVLAGLDECAQPGPDLLEWDYRAYEGRRTAEIPAERPGWRLFEDGCPDGGTLQVVNVRADRVINRVRARGATCSSSRIATSCASSQPVGSACPRQTPATCISRRYHSVFSAIATTWMIQSFAYGTFPHYRQLSHSQEPEASQ
jgi:probable phosphoglycerate mutase